ncbi:MAG: DUF2333 family protein [Pseudomonadota bacterium]
MTSAETSLSDEPATQERRRGPFRRLGGAMRWLLLAFAAISLIYFGYLFYLYSLFHGRDLSYPQEVLSRYMLESRIIGPGEPVIPVEAVDTADGECRPSATVAMQVAVIDYMAVQNAWVPARPLYKLGFFGLVDFEDTPWFDNKASEQKGMLDISRRTGIEMVDSLGRIRGSSLENPQLSSAQSSLQIDENAWFVNNPFNPQVNTISPSAASSYASAIPLYQRYNRDLAACEATFDTRADNLRAVLSRFTATLGATTAELEARSKAWVYDPATDRLVRGEGNNLGWFDFRADNYFHRARGQMYALHGILQGMRVDFGQVITDRNVDEVWDKMEATIGEAAMMDPWITSNGANDSTFVPDHLTAMAEMILRARTAMVEIRDILAS